MLFLSIAKMKRSNRPIECNSIAVMDVAKRSPAARCFLTPITLCLEASIIAKTNSNTIVLLFPIVITILDNKITERRQRENIIYLTYFT